jgi:hypothetical protein
VDAFTKAAVRSALLAEAVNSSDSAAEPVPKSKAQVLGSICHYEQLT